MARAPVKPISSRHFVDFEVDTFCNQVLTVTYQDHHQHLNLERRNCINKSLQRISYITRKRNEGEEILKD